MKKRLIFIICIFFITAFIVSINAQEIGSRILKLTDPYMNGEDVKKLQEFLISKGYSLLEYGADSYYGGETESVVKKWQKDSGIKVDGIFGDESYNEYLRQKQTKKIELKTYISPGLLNKFGVSTNEDISKLLGFPYWVQRYYQVRLSQDKINYVVVGPYGQELISANIFNAKEVIITKLAQLGVEFEFGKPKLPEDKSYIPVISSEGEEVQPILLEPFWSSYPTPETTKVFVKRYVRDYSGIFPEHDVESIDFKLRTLNEGLLRPVYIVVAGHNGKNPKERGEEHYENYFKKGRIYGKYEKQGILIFYIYEEDNAKGEAIPVKRHYVFIEHPKFKWGLSNDEIKSLVSQNDALIKENPKQALLNVAEYITDELREHEKSMGSIRAIISIYTEQNGLEIPGKNADDIIEAMIMQETGGIVNIRGSSGECGLMQLMSYNVVGWGYKYYRSPNFDDPKSCWIPENNIDMGVRHYKGNVQTCKDWKRGLCAYNTGKCYSSCDYQRSVLANLRQIEAGKRLRLKYK